MAITYPMSLLDGAPFWSTDFTLEWRQEQSRQTNGRTIVKDFGSPLWRATYQSISLKPNELDYWRARLNALENGLQTFYGRPLSRCYPIADPGGTILNDGPTLYLDFAENFGYIAGEGAVTVDSINANRKELSLSGLRPGYVLSVGDYISIEDDLHQLVSGATADGDGETGEFEVRPHIWPGVSAGASVTIVKPYCIMALVPGSLNSTADLSTGRGTISFQAIEAR